MVVNWSALSQKNTHTHTHTYTHMHTHTHTQERERNTWEMDNRFLTTVRELTLPPKGRMRCEVLLWTWKCVRQRNGRAEPAPLAPTGSGGLRVQLQAFLCSVKWPKVSKTFLSDEELEAGPCAEISAPLFPRFSFSAVLSSSLASTPGSWFFSSFSQSITSYFSVNWQCSMIANDLSFLKDQCEKKSELAIG